MRERRNVLRLFILCLPVASLLLAGWWRLSLSGVSLLPVSQRTQAFRQAVKDVDTVVFRTGGQCHRAPYMEKKLAVWRGTEARSFISALQVTDGPTEDCACCGSHTFEFLQNGKRVLALTTHHGERIRCLGGPWEGDAYLSGPSKIYLQNVARPYGGLP